MRFEFCTEIVELGHDVAQLDLVAQCGRPSILHVAFVIGGLNCQVVTLATGTEDEFIGYKVGDAVEDCVHVKLDLCMVAVFRQVVRMQDALRRPNIRRLLGP